MRSVAIALLILLLSVHNATARPLRVICVEAVWCNIVSQLGAGVIVTQDLTSRQSIDPHFQQISASQIKRLSDADYVIVNGAGYDDWAARSIHALGRTPSSIITVSALAPEVARRNPHLYDSLDVVTRFAQQWTSTVTQILPQDRDRLIANQNGFFKDLSSLRDRIAVMRERLQGSRVAESEPVSALLLEDLRMVTINQRFALAIMHHAEPSPQDVARLEAAFQNHDVRVFIVNATVSAPSVDALKVKARQAGIPIIYSAEYPPENKRWQDWMNDQLSALDKALP